MMNKAKNMKKISMFESSARSQNLKIFILLAKPSEGYDRPPASLFFLVVVRAGPTPSAENIV